MPWFRRRRQAGGTYFFTLVTENRAPLFADGFARILFHQAIAETRRSRPFEIEAIVLLPDHLHLLMTLPSEDDDFSARLSQLKSQFTRTYLAAGGIEQPRSNARVKGERRGVWQRWFWEHLIRDEDDYSQHLQYTLFNPVKHGHAKCPHEWPWSSFGRHVRDGEIRDDWHCVCNAGRLEAFTDPPWADQCEP